MNRARRGYSLVEMLVVVAVVGLVSFTLQDVLLSGMRSIARTRAAETVPQLDTTWLSLRRDLQSAAAPPAPRGAWVEAPLELPLPGGATVRLLLRNGALVREEGRAGEAEPLRRRVLARPVRSFRWRVPDDGLVEVELTPAREWDASAGRPLSPRPSSLLCATRGSGRAGGAW